MGRRSRTPQVIAYTRVSTAEQGDSGLGLEAQEAAIRAECERRGWDINRFASDVASGKDIKGRPGFTAAVDDLDANGGILIAAKLDRLSRTLLDFVALMERAARNGWAVVVLDVATDTTTPQGEMLANLLATFAHFERRIIGQRTKDALAAKKAQGARLGRPVTLAQSTRARIAEERAGGRTLQQIADGLNHDGVATARGGSEWRPSSVRAVLTSLERDAEAHESSALAA